FFALFGGALLLAAEKHRRLQRTGREPGVWGIALALVFLAVGALGAAATALATRSPALQALAWVGFEVVVPAGLHALLLGKDRTWHALGWMQVRLQGSCTMAVLAACAIATRGRAGVLVLISMATAGAGLAVQAELKRRRRTLAGLDHNSA